MIKHDSRNLKYGSTAAIVSVVLIAAILMINVIFSALSSKYSFYSDMTKNETYTLTEELKLVLGDVTEKVEVIFCHERDYIDANVNLHDVLETADNLDKEYDWLSVRFVNIIKDPLEVKDFMTSSEDTVKTTDVIVRSGNEYRRLDQKNFYVLDSDGQTVWGFQAEEQFASAILSVTAAEQPIAYYTTSHQESIPLGLSDIVSKAGYKLMPIDLALENIDPDARLIIVSNPKKDFSGGEGSELEKLDRFLSQDFGSMLCFLDPMAEDLKNLEAYLYEWGVVFDNSIVKDEGHSVSLDSQSIVADYCTGNTAGASLIDEVAALATRPKTIFKNAGTISINPSFTAYRENDDEAENGLGEPNGSYISGSRDISPVFTAGEGALSYASKGGSDDALDCGGSPLMTLTRQRTAHNNDYYSSYVLCANTALFCEDDWIVSNTYGNTDVLYASLSIFGREKVPSGIDFKETANYDIEDMTTAEADTWTAILVSVLPVAVAVVGLVVCIRRKYR